MCSFRHLIVMVMSSDCGRNLIGWRTQSDQVADGIRLGGGRKPIGWRVPSRGCTCLRSALPLARARSAPTKLSSTQQNCQVPNKTVKCTNFLSVVNILAWMVHLRQVHPLKEPLARLVQFLLAWLVHFLLWQAAKPSGDKCTP